MKYKFLRHTADVKFRAFGKSLEEAFSNAALATFSVMVDTKKIKPVITKKVDITAIDLKALLYKWLEELLYLNDVNHFFLHKIKFIKINKKKYSLKAVVVGDKFKEGYAIEGGIKSVTYNDMLIKKVKRGFVVQVVLDI